MVTVYQHHMILIKYEFKYEFKYHSVTNNLCFSTSAAEMKRFNSRAVFGGLLGLSNIQSISFNMPT